MCGICVWINRQGRGRPELLARAIQRLRHRGPDNRNLFLWPGTGAGSVLDAGGPLPAEGFVAGLAHARLSIIDLDDASNQPMFSADGKRGIVFNGEVYNYLELRRELRQEGLEFRTAGDTEVLLGLLGRRGPDALRQVNGMWAFALLDLEERSLLLSRDRYGKKPLFYYVDDENLIAASEFKAIFAILEALGRRRRVNPRYLTAFLAGKRYPTFDDGQTFYRDIREVPHGCSLRFDLERFDSLLLEQNRIGTWFDQPADMDALGPLIADAVNLRLRSDGPVAVMVSGGVDSTMVAAHVAGDPEARRNTAFYTFPTSEADLRHSRALAQALGITLVEVPAVREEEVDACLGDLIRQFEIPVNLEIIALPGYLTCRRMAADGIRVVLDGTGGDEVLGGYPANYSLALDNLRRERRFWQALRMKLIVDSWEKKPLAKRLSRWLQFFGRMVLPKAGQALPTPLARAELLGGFGRSLGLDETLAVVGDCFARDAMTGVGDMQRFELERGLMPSYLYMTDQISMIHSLEMRSPLLDYRLAGYVNMPLREKFHDGFNKYRLRRLLPATVPDSVRWRRDKQGFAFMPRTRGRATDGDTLRDVRNSPLLNEIYDTPRLVSAWEARRGDRRLASLMNYMYSVCSLERLYDLGL
jgi:asparagine synthase (glutamine-hydrolysing)